MSDIRLEKKHDVDIDSQNIVECGVGKMMRGIDEIKKDARIYFIGIGGISMSGLALLSTGYGFTVGGSDMNPSERTEMLSSKGVIVFDKQTRENIESFGPDLVVKTAAILPHNPEVAYCLEKNIQILDRSEFLGLITRSYERVINISGTHGKTTTTAMTSLMLIESMKDPTVHLGADLDYFGGTVRLGGNRELLISEACEFKRSFLQFSSTTAAITNIDHDHVDCYPELQDVIDVFAEFLDKVDDNGYVVVIGSDINTSKALEIAKLRHEAQGRKMPQVVTCEEGTEICAFTGEKPRVCAENITFDGGLPRFDAYIDGAFFGHIELKIPGKHNVDNALVAIACAYFNGGDPEKCVKALNSFNGADGRYTVKGKFNGATVVVDYAHHPSAARATIEAASHMPHKDILVVFQPLTFNRTEALFKDYVASLLPCKKVLFSEIFSDREVNTGKISSKKIADAIVEKGGDAEFFADKNALKARVAELAKPDDIILILGPEDIRKLGDELTNGGNK